MKTVEERIRHHFTESIQVKIDSADSILAAIEMAGSRLVQCLLDGHKIISCGNGGSAGLATHFTALMLNHLKEERPSLPSITLSADTSILTSIANRSSYHDIFARQLRALGVPGDVLLALTTSGNTQNIVNVITAAQDRDIGVVVLNGGDGGKVSELLQPQNIEIRIPSHDTARILENHLLIIHSLTEIIDFQLFDHGE